MNDHDLRGSCGKIRSDVFDYIHVLSVDRDLWAKVWENTCNKLSARTLAGLLVSDMYTIITIELFNDTYDTSIHE